MAVPAKQPDPSVDLQYTWDPELEDGANRRLLIVVGQPVGIVVATIEQIGLQTWRLTLNVHRTYRQRSTLWPSLDTAMEYADVWATMRWDRLMKGSYAPPAGTDVGEGTTHAST